MRVFERVPYDIWHLIFQQVCTDGGYSGCSLALTSKTFRALSACTRFYSLSLCSLREVKNFLICYERIRRFNVSSTIPVSDSTQSRTVLPIHNLSLSFLLSTSQDVPPRVHHRVMDYARTESSLIIQLLHDRRAWDQAKNIWNRDFVLSLSHLLHLAAPTLRTLTVLQCGAVRLPLLRTRLPVLRELTLFGDDRIFVRVPEPGAHIPGENDPSDFAFYGVPTTPWPEDDPPFPALTHLHVVYSGPKLHPWERSLPLWAALAPAVTHLRVSQGDDRLPRVLVEMLGVTHLYDGMTGHVDADAEHDVHGQRVGEGEGVYPDSPVQTMTAPTYPSLRMAVIQMCGARRNRDGGDMEPTSRELECMRDACAMRGWDEEDGAFSQQRVVVLRSRAYQPDYWEARLRWEWEARLAGGCGGGCWREDEADENAWKAFGGGKEVGNGRKGKLLFQRRMVAHPALEDRNRSANNSRWRRVLAKVSWPRRSSTA